MTELYTYLMNFNVAKKILYLILKVTDEKHSHHTVPQIIINLNYACSLTLFIKKTFTICCVFFLTICCFKMKKQGIKGLKIV